jgi:hypothetical protein
VAVTTGFIPVVMFSTDRPVIIEAWRGASVRPIRHGWQRRYRLRMKSILLSMGMVVVVVSTMVMIIALLTLRDGECTIPQQTCKRSFWRTGVFGWLESRYDSFLDGAGYGGHVSGGTFW